MYPGFLQYDGLEVANAVRTAAYVESLGLGWFKTQEACLGLAGFLPDYPYTSPTMDPAPWYDASRAESLDFAGFWPLEVTGIDTTTFSRPVSERLSDGGVLGLGRHASRAIVVRGVLLGKTDESISAGMSWLTATLERRGCNVNPLAPNYLLGCTGADFDYLALCPGDCGCGQTVCDTACHDQWERHLYDVGLVEGPEVLQRRCIHGGGAFAEIQFTMVAANPWRYGHVWDATTSPFSFTYEDFATCFAPDYQYILDTVSSYADIFGSLYDCLHPPGSLAASRTSTVPLTSGGMATVTPLALPPPIVDPTCPTVPDFPFFPTDPITCGGDWTGPWAREVFRFGPVNVEKWVEQIPRFFVHDEFNTWDDIRIRFTPDGGDPDTDWRYEYYVTYLPAATTLNFDAPRDQITTLRFDDYGVPESGEHLVVVNSQGRNERWPIISCDNVWNMTVDLPAGTDPFFSFEVGLNLIAREP